MKKYRIIFLAALLFFALAPAPLRASEREVLLSGELMVVFVESGRATANEVLREYPLIKSELEETFGWGADFERGVRVVLLKEEQFGELIHGIPVVAFADSGDNVVVMGMLRAERDASPFRSILKHELVHLYLGRHIDAQRLPRWLDEGVSQWASGGVSELLWMGKTTEIEKATLRGGLIPLEDLERSFPGGEKPLRLAYQESLSIVNFIVAEHGEEGLRGVLGSLKDGNEIDGAVSAALGVGMEELQEAWLQHLNRRHTLLTYLGDHFYTFLFVFAALLTVYGFARAVIKARNYRNEDKETDRKAP